MTNFVDELREELVSAAEREQFYRPRLGLSSPRVLLAVVATAAVAILVVFGAATLKGPVDRATPVATPTPETRPLFGGTLTPGVRYETRAFVPALSFVVADDQWSANDTTLPDALLLEHGEGTFDPGGERRPAGGLAFSRITEVFDLDLRGPEPSRWPAPADLYSWLRAHPDLRVGPAEPVTVAGVPGERFDVEVRFDRPTYPVPMCRRRFQVACTTFTPGVFIQDGTLLQMTILQTEPDPLVIAIDHFTHAGMREMERAAAPVLDSLLIGVR